MKIEPRPVPGRHARTLLISAVLIAVASATGCGIKDRVILRGATRLNKCTEADEPHSLKVRIYYLKGQDRFREADFRSLWEDHESALGGDLLELELATVNPDGELTVTLSRKGKAEEAKFLGVVADFCRAETDCWRRIVALAGRGTKTQLHFGEACVTVQ